MSPFKYSIAKVICVKVINKTEPSCTSITLPVTTVGGSVIAKVPVTLAELTLQVNLDSLVSLPEPALAFSVVSDTEITATVPPSTSLETVQVTVNVPGCESSNGLTYTYSGFMGATAVLFGSEPATTSPSIATPILMPLPHRGQVRGH
ncbi:hypothetical protein [Desulfotomaculum sp. 1211_IL3151]|uniref:hypothetical protein n=1 Tax=Desulfotomaculum sp. 1211_IL3151 TaxID=3084055 RepID=UPI002FDABE96